MPAPALTPIRARVCSRDTSRSARASACHGARPQRRLDGVPLPNWLLEQLGHPSGMLGHLVASAMDRSNRTMALHAVGALDLEGAPTVLDLGFGSGVAIAMILAHAPEAKVVGVEPSSVAIRSVQRRFARALATGRLRLLEGALPALPLEDASIDAVLSNNTVYFWPDLDAGLAELARVLRPGGRVVLGIRPVEELVALGFATRGARVIEGAVLAAALARAGFIEPSVRRMPDPTGTVIVEAVRR